MPTPTPIPIQIDSTSTVLANLEPWMLIIVIILTLGALMLSLWLVYSYINNIRTTDIHRTMLWDAVFQARYRELQEQANYGEAAWEDDPEWLESERNNVQANLEEAEANLNRLMSQETRDPVEEQRVATDIRYYERELKTRYSDENIERIRANKSLETQNRQRRDQRDREKASQEADTLVPRSLTVAGMGITGSFFIELTAILTIIFGIIILGLVEVLRTQEIATILAAIAGYVLGKTSAGPQTSQPSAPQTFQPSAPQTFQPSAPQTSQPSAPQTPVQDIPSESRSQQRQA